MSDLLASLPMYDWPEICDETEKLWTAIADRFGEQGFSAPANLLRDVEGIEHWLDSNLLLSQTCGYPFAVELEGKVDLLGTPVYEVDGCGGAFYSSAIVVRSDEDVSTLDDAQHFRFVFNSKGSLSGFRCLSPMTGDPSHYFETVVESGGHRRSAQMVADGHADIAAIDAVCWHLLQKVEPETADKLRVLAWTPKLPALPFITAVGRSKDELTSMRRALSVAVDDVRNQLPTLCLAGLNFLDETHYRPLAALSSFSS